MFGGIAVRTNFDQRRGATDRFFKNVNNDVDKSLKRYNYVSNDRKGGLGNLTPRKFFENTVHFLEFLSNLVSSELKSA